MDMSQPFHFGNCMFAYISVHPGVLVFVLKFSPETCVLRLHKHGSGVTA